MNVFVIFVCLHVCCVVCVCVCVSPCVYVYIMECNLCHTEKLVRGLGML